MINSLNSIRYVSKNKVLDYIYQNEPLNKLIEQEYKKACFKIVF